MSRLSSRRRPTCCWETSWRPQTSEARRTAFCEGTAVRSGGRAFCGTATAKNSFCEATTDPSARNSCPSREEAEAYASKLKACRSIQEGRRLHSELASRGWNDSTFIGNHLVQMYGSFGDPHSARTAFDRLHVRNVFSWTILVGVYAHNGYLHEARIFFQKMPEQNAVSWNAIIAGYAQDGDLIQAQEMFNRMPQPDTVSWNSLISAYAHDGELQQAESLFLSMPHKSVVSWTAMLTAYAQAGYLHKAHALFDEMPNRNIVSWNSLMSAYAQMGQVEAARLMFETLPYRDLVSWNCMIPAYARSRRLDEAKCVFDAIPSPNVLSWTSMLAAYAEEGQIEEAKSIFVKMQQRDVGSWNALIAAYGQSDDLPNAKKVFDRMPQWSSRSWSSMFLAQAQLMADVDEIRKVLDGMPEKHLPSWNAMLTAYTRETRGEEALELFKLMIVEGVQPNEISFICAVDACSQIGALIPGRCIESELGRLAAINSVELGNCFISMYTKCGSFGDAKRHFDGMNERDSVSWTAMITCEAQSGYSSRALALFLEMVHEGFNPHEVTFLGVLSACAYAGLLRDGWSYWIVMVADFRVAPRAEHYAWLVNLLARSGRLGDAEDLVDNMPFEPEYTTWGALLGGCSITGSTHGASRAAAQISSLDPQNTAPYVELAKICASAVDAYGEKRKPTTKHILLSNPS